MKDIFNPDSYTRAAMPLSTDLFIALCNTGDFDRSSTAVKECRERYEEINKRFSNSLTDEQKELYFEVDDGDAEQHAIESAEAFNKGLCFGISLMKEIFS